MNFVYADDRGNIGYQYAARVPKRRNGHGVVPAPGWDDSHDWLGFVPFEELPSQFNPPDGFAASANNRPPQRLRRPVDRRGLGSRLPLRAHRQAAAIQAALHAA